MRNATLFILLLFAATLHAQQQTFRGRVVDAETGEPLPYVEISVSQKLRTLSNRHGIFAVEARTKNMLIFSHVGYEEVEMVPTDNVEVKMWPLKYEPSGMSEAEIENVLKKTKKVFSSRLEGHDKKSRLYYYRFFCCGQDESRLSEAIMKACSANNLRKLEYIRHVFYNDVSDETSGEMPLYLRRTFINNVLQLGPNPLNASVWRNMLVRIPFSFREEVLSSKYHLECDVVKDGDKTLLYRIHLYPHEEVSNRESTMLDADSTIVLPAPTVFFNRGILAGTMYLNNKKQLVSFDGELLDYGIETVTHGWLSATAGVHIDYVHDHKYPEVKVAVGELEYDGIYSRAFVFNITKPDSEAELSRIIPQTEEEKAVITKYLKQKE